MIKRTKRLLIQKTPGFARWLQEQRIRGRRLLQSGRRHYTLDGVVFPKDRQLISEQVARAIESGRYEQEERKQLRKLLRRGDVVVELGTGLGVVSTVCAMDPRVKHITTIEANPALIPYARGVHRLNGVQKKVCLINAVAQPAPTEDCVTFYVRKNFWGSSTTPGGQVREALPVRVIDLNEIMTAVAPSILVVDIEGGEADLFDGLDMTTVRHISLEIHRNVLGGIGVAKLFNQLSAAGFHYDPRTSQGRVVTFTRNGKLRGWKRPERPTPRTFINGALVTPWQPVPEAPGGYLPSPLAQLSGTRNNNLVYNLNQKAGCTTVLNFLVALELGEPPAREDDVHHDVPDVLLRWDDAALEDILLGPDPFVFTFVRNPYRRFLSGFFDKIASDKDRHFEGYRKHLRENWKIPETVDEGNATEAVDRFLDFLDHRLAKHHGIYVKEPHFNPQTHNINYTQIRYSFIGQVERLQEGLQEVLQHSRLQPGSDALFQRRFNRTRLPLYERYELTTEQRERLKLMYRVDFENFGAWYDPDA